MIVLGLTGSIGMGKSVLARQFKKLGVPVHEADAAVHKLLGLNGRAVKAVAKLFPQALQNKRIDRKILGEIVFKNPTARKKLEKILHPLVRADSKEFLKYCRRNGEKLAVLDIPLLFETRQEKRCDHILCVSAPQFVQKRRVLKRKNMNEQKLKAILKLQMPDACKRRKSDTVINTTKGYRHSLIAAKKLIQKLKRKTRKDNVTPQNTKQKKKSLGYPACHL